MPFDLEKGVFARPRSSKRVLFLCAVFFAIFLTTVLLPHSAQTIRFHKAGSLSIPLPNFFSTERPAQSAPAPRLHPACQIWPGWRTSIPQSAPMNNDSLLETSLGSAEFMGGSAERACVPAAARLGPFGHNMGSPSTPKTDEMPWSSLHWGELQSACAAQHYDSAAAPSSVLGTRLQRPPPDIDEQYAAARSAEEATTGRTAVVLRTWDSYDYSENQLAWLRTLIAELALDTGGQYQVFLLVDVKDAELDLLGSEAVYQAALARSVPAEFRDMALLYNAPLLQHWFPAVPEHGAQDQMYQALQVFSAALPAFDHVWQLEMDLRLTGNAAAMLSAAGAWAATQPRRSLWERNARFYVPGRWNGSHAAFAAAVDADLAADAAHSVWGPPPHAAFFVDPAGPRPPPRARAAWGVGEPAELLTLAPLVDPAGSGWTYEHALGGFPAGAAPPRRMAMVSVTRTSRRLLRLVAAAQRAAGAWLVSEATPETFALLHGLKAVYVPHLVAFDLKAGDAHGPQAPPGTPRARLAPAALDAMLHRGPAWSRAGGARAGFLYCADTWLGEHRWLDASYFYWAGEAARVWGRYVAGECAPPMVLHPVKGD